MRNRLIWTFILVATALGFGLLPLACATKGGATAAREAPTCNSCLNAQCPTAYHDCFGDAACTATFTCSQKCATGDKKCVWDCILARPNTAARFFAASECGTSQCKDSCPLPGGVINACPVCSAKFCPNEINACFGNKECWDLVYCVRDTCEGVRDVECVQACIGKHPGGLAEIQGLRDCSSQHCVAACSAPEK